MTNIRLLQSGSKRLLESGSNLLLEGTVPTAPKRASVAGFRLRGPLPNVDAHVFAMARLDKLSSRPSRFQTIYLPGGNGNELSWQGGTDTNPSETGDVVRDVVDRGGYHRRLVTLPTDWTWGDSTMVTRIDSMLTYAEANYGFSPPYHLIGVSMGTPCCFNWAINNLDRVRSIACMLPAVDLQDIQDNRAPLYPPPAVQPPSFAYGTTTIPNAYNPAHYAASLSGVPIKLWYSNNDTICNPATVTTFASASGATAVNIGNETSIVPGHGLDTGFVVADVGTFLAAND